MFYIDGVPYYATADFKAWGIYEALKSAVAVHGWQHESLGLWRGDAVGNNGLTIAEWVSQRRLIRTRDLVGATRFSRQHLSQIANDNDLKPVAKGRWDLESAAKLLQVLGRLARCPLCKGVAAMHRDGELTCLECKQV